MASSLPINAFNTAIKASGVWDAWMQANGIDTTPGRPVRLSDAQRKDFQRYLQSQGAKFPRGVEIDTSGNMNEDEGFTKELKKWGPLAAGAAVMLFGIPGTPIAGLLGGGSGAAAGAGAAGVPGGFGLTGVGGGTGMALPTVTAGAAGVGLGGTLLRYGLQYGLPVAGGLIGTQMQTNAQRDSDRLINDYYDKALEAEKEERDYRRTFDEEGRRYGRFRDAYGLKSDEDILRYGRATDTYGRLSDEERLAYDRSQTIRDKNYGYQQYGNFVETLEPFRAPGAAATSRMSGLLGGPTLSDTGSYLNLARTARESVQTVPNVPDRPTWDFKPNRPTWNYEGGTPARPDRHDTNDPPVSTTMPIGGRAPLVPMRTPGGQRFDVDPREVASYEARGAVRDG